MSANGFDRAKKWSAHYALLAELLNHMPSLYNVMQRAHANNSSCSYIVAVPPDSEIPQWARSKNGRVSQGYVRSHLFSFREGLISGLAENVNAVLKLHRPQPFFSQCPGSDSEEEQSHLFGANTVSAIVDEMNAVKSSNPFVQESVFAVDNLKSAPTQGTLTITTPWSLTGKIVGVYAIDQVRNAAPTNTSSQQPFLTLIFIDGSLYCEFDWDAVQIQNSADELKPGVELSSNQQAAAASLRANINFGTVPPSPPQPVEASKPSHSWLSRLYNQIAFAAAKPTVTTRRVRSKPTAVTSTRESTRGDGDKNDDVLPPLQMEASMRAPSLNKEESMLGHRSRRKTVGPNGSRRGSVSSRNNSARSSNRSGANAFMDPSKSRIFEAAPMFRALLTITNENVADETLLRLDTELVIFQSTYVCVSGFEQFTVSKVNRIIESLTSDFVEGIAKAGKEAKIALETAKEAERKARAKRRQQQLAAAEKGVALPVEAPKQTTEDATSSRAAPCPIELSAEEKAQLLDGASDTDIDIIVTAFHTIFTAGIVPVALAHWRTIYADADETFQRQCLKLRRRKPSDFGVDLGDLPIDALEPAVLLVGEFDNNYSVFTFMRIAERILSVVVEAMDLWDVTMTADVSIPLLVFLLCQGQPQRMMSTINFVTGFSLQALDMSALGYSFTTVEAAAQQLVQEYNTAVNTPGVGDETDDEEPNDDAETFLE